MKNTIKPVVVKGTRKDRPCVNSFMEKEKDLERKLLIKQYVHERNTVLNKADVNELKKFAEKWKLPFPENMEIAEITMHKMIVNCEGLYPKVKANSKKWLKEKGFIFNNKS
jgi:hypothetical protein